MKTGAFKTYTGDHGVAICLYPPLDWTGARFPVLEPDRKTFFAKKAGNIDEKEYEKRYREETLSRLDPQEIYNTLKNQVLLCWEPEGQFCHRRLVAKWIEENLGIEVLEWNPNDEIKESDGTKPLF